MYNNLDEFETSKCRNGKIKMTTSCSLSLVQENKFLPHQNPKMYAALGESKIAPLLLATAKSTDRWFEYFGFNTCSINFDLLMTDPFLKNLAEKHEFIAGVLKMDEFSCYNWHIDTVRRVTINMLLEHTDSDSMFIEDPNALKSMYGVFKVHKLTYKPSTYYAFNTQRSHKVLNRAGERYVFSVQFTGKSKHLGLDQLCSDFGVKWE